MPIQGINNPNNDVNTPDKTIIEQLLADMEAAANSGTAGQPSSDPDAYTEDTYTINGTDSRDTIGVFKNASNGLDIIHNGTKYTVDKSKVRIYGKGGNDRIVIGDDVDVESLDTGSGDDIVYNEGTIRSATGGTGRDLIRDRGTASYSGFEQRNKVYAYPNGATVCSYTDENNPANNLCIIDGTDSSDQIDISRNGTNLVVTINGHSQTVSHSSFKIYGKGGNDNITIDDDIEVEYIDTGDGNDIIYNEGTIRSGTGGDGTDKITNRGEASYSGFEQRDELETYNGAAIRTYEDDITPTNNFCIIGGSDSADIISISKKSGNQGLRININGKYFDVLPSKLFVDTGKGDDKITVNNGVDANCIHTGDGADKIFNYGNIRSASTGYGNDEIQNKSAGRITTANTGGGDDKVFNYGQITTANTGDGIDEIENKSTGKITAANTEAGNDTIKNWGTITAANTGDNNDSVYNYERIWTVNTGNGTDYLYNNDRIETANTGSGADTVENTGTIEGKISTGSHNDTINNTGTIEGEIDTESGNDTINNSGTLEKEVNTGDDGDTINNSGTIKGKVNTESGGDTVNNSGILEDEVNTGSENDTLINSGSMVKAVTGTGDDRVENKATGSITTSVETGDGSDTIVNEENGSITAADTGEGNDLVQNFGSISSAVTTGNGNDRVVNGEKGYIRSVDTGNGNDTVINHADPAQTSVAGRIGSIFTATGNNLVINYGIVESRVTTGDDDDRIFNYGSVNQSYTGGGNDHLYNYGSIGTADTQDGDDEILNQGTIHYARGGQGSNSITTEGTTASLSGFERRTDVYATANGAKVYVYENDQDPANNYCAIRGSNENDTIDVARGAGGNGFVITVNEKTFSVNQPHLYVFGEEGDDNITIGNGVTVKYVSGGDGDDTVDNKGSIVEAVGGEGNDHFIVGGNASIAGFDQHSEVIIRNGVRIDIYRDDSDPANNRCVIEGTDSDDEIRISRDSNGDGLIINANGVPIPIAMSNLSIYSKNGHDNIIIDEGVEVAEIDTGAGNDNVSSRGSIHHATGGSGRDAFINRGDAVHSGFEYGDEIVFTKNGTKISILRDPEDPSRNSCVIEGTNEIDKIRVSRSGNGLSINVNGETFSLALSSLYIYGNGGNDNIIIDEDVEVAYLDTGYGNDTVKNAGVIRNAVTGSGDDTLSNEASGRIKVADTGSGRDTISNLGILEDTIRTGDGDDNIYNYGSIGIADTGNNDDYILNQGTINNLRGGQGADNITGEGNVTYLSEFEQRTDIVTSASGIKMYRYENYLDSDKNYCSIYTTDANDTIQISKGAGGQGFTVDINGESLSVGPTNLYINSNGGDDHITVEEGVTVNSISGGLGKDTIINEGSILSRSGSELITETFTTANGTKITLYENSRDFSKSYCEIKGSDYNDTITVAKRANGQGFTITVNEKTFSIDPTNLFIFGEGGDDLITVEEGVSLEYIDGGDGNDDIYNYGSANQIKGGSGINRLYEPDPDNAGQINVKVI